MNILSKIIEPKEQIPEERKKFDNKALFLLILPLALQDLLTGFVGLADSAMVTHVSENAVSGVSLVNTLNFIVYLIFVAVSSGGAVIASQYIGRKDKKHVDEAAGQLTMIILILSVILSVIVLLFKEPIFDLVYGNVTKEVRGAGLKYLNITAYSFISLALFSGFSALLRSIGKTKTILYVSIVMNVVNLVGNIIGVFVLKADVAGVAYPTVISRFVAAVCTGVILCKKGEIQLKLKNIFTFKARMIARIMSIAVPSGIESGVFQIAKVVVTSLVTVAGTAHIAAYGITQDFWGISATIGTVMSPVFVTIIGQYMGAGDKDGAQYYMRKLLRIAIVVSLAWNVIVGILAPVFLQFYSLEDDTRRILLIIMYLHIVLYSFIAPFAFPLSNGLQATGDVKYTLVSVIIGTLIVRMSLAYVLGVLLGLGAIGVTLAMIIDWVVKGTLIFIRYKSGKWKNKSVI